MVGGGGAKRAPGTRWITRPNITDQNTKSTLIWMNLGTRGFRGR